MHQTLQDGARSFNLRLNPAQLDAFQRYSQELIRWNKQLNLTRIVEPAEITVKHFLDSLSVYQALADLPLTFSMIDVGTGAGFPGLPLKIAQPEIELTLLETTGKKAKFLQHIVDCLNLKQVTVLKSRAEDAGRDRSHRAGYDVAVARAVARLPVLIEYSLPLIRAGGRLIAQKGQDPVPEIEAAENALKLLGGKIDRVVPVEVPGLNAARHLIVIRKTKSTARRFPRRSGTPAKMPL